MATCRYKPWIGADCRSSATRLLVIGESHYGSDGEDEPGLTNRVVDLWRSGALNHRYFTILARVLTGQTRDALDRPAAISSIALSSIAFSNYLQRLFCEDNNEQPDGKDFNDAQQPFLDLVRDLDPTHILVTSVRAFTGMPPELRGYKKPLGDDIRYVCEYATPSGKAYATAVKHLSRQSAEVWMPVMDAGGGSVPADASGPIHSLNQLGGFVRAWPHDCMGGVQCASSR